MSNINLNHLRDRAYQCACAHGFHDEELSDEHFLMLVITELAEAVEADRQNKRSNYPSFKAGINFQAVTTDEMWKEAFEAYLKNTVEDELADAVIRLLDLAGYRKFDLNDTMVLCYCVDEEKTFTENCYLIVQNLSDARHSVEENINYSMRQILKLASFYDIDLLWHIEQKMKYNEFRGYKHGKLY